MYSRHKASTFSGDFVYNKWSGNNRIGPFRQFFHWKHFGSVPFSFVQHRIFVQKQNLICRVSITNTNSQNIPNVRFHSFTRDDDFRCALMKVKVKICFQTGVLKCQSVNCKSFLKYKLEHRNYVTFLGYNNTLGHPIVWMNFEWK